MDLSQLNNIAIKAALSAGKVIQKYMNDDVSVEKKKGGVSYASQVVTAVDRACETAILSHLLPTCREFDLALLSEESEDDATTKFDEFDLLCDAGSGMESTRSFRLNPNDLLMGRANLRSNPNEAAVALCV